MSRAQIKVISNGNVGIGNTSPAAKLDVNGYTKLDDLDVSGGVTINGNVGINNSSPSAKLDVNGDTKLDELDVSGQVSIMSNSWTGGIIFDNSATWGLATIRPASSSDGSWLGTSSYPFHTSYVEYTYSRTSRIENLRSHIHINGDSYTWSDGRLKSNIKGIEKPMETLMKLEGKKYDMEAPSVGLTKDKEQKIKKNDEFGFIAQEFKEVLPELTILDTVTDYYAINYVGLIPIIVEALKSQQAEISMLKDQVANLQKELKSEPVPSKSASIDPLEEAKLAQNIPNPFTDNTRIDMEIPKSVQTARLYIYNMQGVQISSFDIRERGTTSIVVEGYTLEAGIYLYSLIADGREVDTKKMIITN